MGISGISKLQPINFNRLNVNPIPLEFSNSLTTCEILGYITNKINSFIININEVIEHIDTYTESRLTSFRKDNIDMMNSLRTDYSILSQALEKRQSVKLEEFTNELNRKLDEIEKLVELIDSEFATLKELINNNESIVYNPTNGLNENESKVINDIYESLRTGSAISCKSYDILAISCESYDTLSMSCMEYDTRGVNLISYVKE